MAELVGIECGANGERENLAGVHVLHDDGAVVGLGALHGVVERVLGHELNVLVDGEDADCWPGSGSCSLEPSTFAARVHGGVHRARNAVQLRVELLLEAAEAVVVDADVAEHLRGDLVVGIEALKLLLEINALHVEGVDAGCRLQA